ncbi:hypothetical protein UFOVP301_30 [uncultured Caudovirales phage]|uniref:Uncharacterized protein n=1 Tax=uncultured Caudovirales phage TaxID=2100421 RepID=A0A6J5N0P5_9CAUD|nr:hypothetical protein UFOVP301_30 [uncultured Caudovirales phage]CAB4150856.1 hypothetical protein UFOVP576_41 [uncultured Caudovirales phage]CAB4199580.1 hypothetical protein UFOVP1350_7 [uncultured Caudovirales phage]
MTSEITTIEIMPTTIVESMTRAEVDVQISTAKRYPRSIGQVKKDMLSFATLDQETAESCFYSLPRGGKNIQGPSVRLAEIAVACYGNLRAGVRVIETVSTGEAPHVVLQAVCHDLEKNTCVTIEKRRRITKKKNKDAVDEDDINLACNAGSAIAFRDCVFKVVPGALIKPVYEQAKAVAIGDAKTLTERRDRAVAAFGKMGVKLDKILPTIGKKSLEEIDLADLETLFGLHTAIKDGHTTIDEAFRVDVPPPSASTSKLFKSPPTVQNGASPDAELSRQTVPQNEAPSLFNEPETCALDAVKAWIIKSGVKWTNIDDTLYAQGVTSELRNNPDDCTDDELRDVLAMRSQLEAVKGGKK